MLEYLIKWQTKMKLKQWQSIFHVILNVNVILEHVVQTKIGMIKHVNRNAKVTLNVKKTVTGILP